MLRYHRDNAHGVGFKALKVRDDFADVAVEADLNAVAQVLQIVAREAVYMVHREHGEGRGPLGEDIDIFLIKNVAYKGIHREHNALFDSRCSGGEDYDRTLFGIGLIVGERSEFTALRIFFIDIREEMLIGKVNRVLYLRAVGANLVDVLLKSAVIEHHVDICAVEKLGSLFCGDVGRKRDNNVSAEQHSGNAGYVFIVGLADNGDVHTVFRYASQPAANRFAVCLNADIAALFDCIVAHEFYKRLFSVLLCRSAKQLLHGRGYIFLFHVSSVDNLYLIPP